MANEAHGHGNGDAHARRPNFWPLTISTAIVVVILVSLGVWQLQRLAWKENLLAEIEARQAAPPVTVTEVVKLQRANKDIRYLRVQAKGTFLHDEERYYYAPDAKFGAGFDVYTPFQLSDGRGLILVNRGYVPEALKVPSKRAEGHLDGMQDVVGLIRLPGRNGAFTPNNDAAENLWFWRDFDAMTADLTSAELGPKLSLFLDAEQPAPGGWPRGGVRKIEISNRHLGYAWTWFGLALTLLGVYAVLMWGRDQP